MRGQKAIGDRKQYVLEAQRRKTFKKEGAIRDRVGTLQRAGEVGGNAGLVRASGETLRGAQVEQTGEPPSEGGSWKQVKRRPAVGRGGGPSGFHTVLCCHCYDESLGRGVYKVGAR